MISPLEALVVESACTEHWPAEAQEPHERGMTRVLHTDADAGAATPEIQKGEKKFFLFPC